jgi:hypothetical protein
MEGWLVGRGREIKGQNLWACAKGGGGGGREGSVGAGDRMPVFAVRSPLCPYPASGPISSALPLMSRSMDANVANAAPCW